MKAWLIVVALVWAWLHTAWHHVETVDGARNDVANLSHRLLFAGLAVPEGGTPGSSGKDGNPSIFGNAAWATPEELLAVRSALRQGRLIIIRQFLDPDAARTLRNEVGRLFAAKGDWTEFASGNQSKMNHITFDETFHSHLGLNCSHMSQTIELQGVVGSRAWVRHQEHALPGSLGSAAMAQVVGTTPPMLASLNRIMRSEEMSELVAWLFDRAGDHSQEIKGAESVTWELKVTRWRPKRHWAAPHDDPTRPRGGQVGAKRFAAFTLQLCDTTAGDGVNEGHGGAFIWCSPHARVPCAFNQLVLFRLGTGAMHAVEPVVPNLDGGQVSSRWTLQAWASDRSATAANTEKPNEENHFQKYAASLWAYIKRQKLAWAPSKSAVPLETLEPLFVGR